MKKIAITGPESTGKSALAKELAAHFGCIYVPEYARSYLAELNRPYTKADVLCIAKGQLQLEAEVAEKQQNAYLFCDTDVLVCKIWQAYKYSSVDTWIQKQFEQHHYDLFLLCDIDLAWEYDDMREHPEERKILFELYFNELTTAGKNFKIISGLGEDRLNNAITAVGSI
jgi:NadR type nicotinamide-nucleotide adenylyltransferase